MNEEKLQSLGQRVVRCRYWRWMPGMLTLTGHRVSDEDAETDAPTLFNDDLPDLSDPATVGYLLALVREAWSDPRIGVRGYIDDPGDPLYYAVEPLDLEVTGDSEAEALVAALEAAGTQEDEQL
jgi:hypothetical protein